MPRADGALIRSHSTHSRYGAVKNSVNNKLTAGGSSGGSAVAVATGQCDAYVTTSYAFAEPQKILTVVLEGRWARIRVVLSVFQRHILGPLDLSRRMAGYHDGEWLHTPIL